VRVCWIINHVPVHGLRVMSLQVCETMEGVLGLMPALLLPAGRSKVLDAQVNSTSRRREVPR
jgi:hypothetical protein